MNQKYTQEGYVELANKDGQPVWVRRENAEVMKNLLNSKETYYGER